MLIASKYVYFYDRSFLGSFDNTPYTVIHVVVYFATVKCGVILVGVFRIVTG